MQDPQKFILCTVGTDPPSEAWALAKLKEPGLDPYADELAWRSRPNVADWSFDTPATVYGLRPTGDDSEPYQIDVVAREWQPLGAAAPVAVAAADLGGDYQPMGRAMPGITHLYIETASITGTPLLYAQSVRIKVSA